MNPKQNFTPGGLVPLVYTCTRLGAAVRDQGSKAAVPSAVCRPHGRHARLSADRYRYSDNPGTETGTESRWHAKLRLEECGTETLSLLDIAISRQNVTFHYLCIYKIIQ